MAEPETFRCIKCRNTVATHAFGTTQRNHCNQCLWSRHVDNFPGDRKAACGG
ncbi:RNHCP domain-containing protein, partial [Tepidiforma sp.]|uniref:RNHCP domain-containing protein n=1 Tax=Tepidiforma sp. TaxID=2682230 RepID=UPI0034DE2579